MSVAFKRAYDGLLKLFGLMAGLVFAVLSCAITADVILRNLGLFSSAALLELSEYALFVTTFMAAPWVLNQASHVRVDLVLTLVSRGVARVLELLADCAGLVISALLGWHGWRVMADSFSRGDLIYKQLVVPEWILLVVIPASCFLLAVEFVRRIAGTWRGDPLNAGSTMREGF